MIDEKCVQNSVCWLPTPRGSSAALDQRKILETRSFKSKAQVLSEGCVVTNKVAPEEMSAPWVEARLERSPLRSAPCTLLPVLVNLLTLGHLCSGMPTPRPLNWIVPREQPFPHAEACVDRLQALLAPRYQLQGQLDLPPSRASRRSRCATPCARWRSIERYSRPSGRIGEHWPDQSVFSYALEESHLKVPCDVPSLLAFTSDMRRGKGSSD